MSTMDLTNNSHSEDSGVTDMSTSTEKVEASFDDYEMDDNKENALPNNNTLLSPIINPTPLHPIKSYETYCTVPGRLTLLSNLKKYRVTIAEVQRRLSPPECLNASVLGGILRKAKNKDGGKILREQLMSYGVELTSGRRRQVQLTCFSSLVEEEVAQIASDFNLVNSKHYPLKEVAKYVLGDIEVHNAQDASMYRRMGLFYASALLQRILDLHRADRTPLADSFLKFDPRTPHLDEKLQHELSNYTLLTHGFGGRMFIEVLETVLSVIVEADKILKSKN
uniref:Transcription factor AP-2 C-terminal domain-containing protein n=1 Tax=Meloidogyne incognita TaxID=6306 RepID=A0A914KHQ6_MELIC